MRRSYINRFDSRIRRYRQDSRGLSSSHIKGFHRLLDDVMEIVEDAVRAEAETMRCNIDITDGEVTATLWVDGINEYRDSIPMGDLDVRKFASYTKGSKRAFGSDTRILASRDDVQVLYTTDTIWALDNKKVHEVFIDAFENCQA